MRELARVVPPGVDVSAFRPRPRVDALREVGLAPGGRPGHGPRDGRHPWTRRWSGRSTRGIEGAITALFETYDEDVPEPDAAAELRALADRDEPIVGYLGKLIPQKGVELLLEALPALRHDTVALVVGFGSDRDWLAALTIGLRRGDRAALEWLRDVGGLPVDPSATPGPRPAKTRT